ncbi:hypothetical protein Tco_0604722 [Tanacetum coccineum]
MMNRIAIRKKIICLLTAFLHKKPKTLSFPKEVEEIKEQVEEVSSDVQINTIVMPIRITFDNPIDFNDHFSKPKDLKKDLTISFDSTTTSILPHPLLDSDSPFTAELSASVSLLLGKRGQSIQTRYVKLQSIYLNNKEEKKIMDVVDISKFGDATLEKVLKEVKLKIFETDLCFFCESFNQVCLLCEEILNQIPAFNFFCASLESISAIENTWEWCGIANMALIQLGGNSRVDEMILARVSSGFAGEKVWDDIQVVPGFLMGRERGLLGK